MKVITLLNEKGGVGKTTTAITLACALAIQGAKVILADSDMQANATTGMGLSKEPGFHDFIKRGVSPADVLRQVEPERIGDSVKGRLWILPGHEENMSLPLAVSDSNIVLNAIRPLNDLIDYFIIDTSPSQTMFHIAVYIATDAILYPTVLEDWSVNGVNEAWFRREQADKYRLADGYPPIQMLGIQPIRAQLNTHIHQDMLAKLTKRYGEAVLPAIHQRAAWAESAARGMSIFAHAPNSAASDEAWALVDHVGVMIHGTA